MIVIGIKTDTVEMLNEVVDILKTSLEIKSTIKMEELVAEIKVDSSLDIIEVIENFEEEIDSNLGIVEISITLV